MGREASAYQEWFSELTNQPPAPPESPQEPPSGSVFNLESWGLGLRDLSEQDYKTFKVNAGVYVAYVTRGSVADEAGLPRDVVILQIEDFEVATLEDVRALLEEFEAAEAVLFQVKKRDGTIAFYEVPVPEPVSVQR
jgi:serine protease Do